jgi:hypothetical protein
MGAGKRLPLYLKGQTGTNMISIVDEFFALDDFAQELTFVEVSGSGSSVVINGIFDSEYSVNTIGAVTYQNSKPTVVCKSADVENATTSSLVQVGSIWYSVLEVQPEGTGTTTLVLSKDKPHG